MLSHSETNHHLCLLLPSHCCAPCLQILPPLGFIWSSLFGPFQAGGPTPFYATAQCAVKISLQMDVHLCFQHGLGCIACLDQWCVQSDHVPALSLGLKGTSCGPTAPYFACFCFLGFFYFLFSFSDTVSTSLNWPQTHYATKNDLKPLIFLPLPPNCWISRCVLPCLVICSAGRSNTGLCFC